jgi:hypothetical protein
VTLRCLLLRTLLHMLLAGPQVLLLQLLGLLLLLHPCCCVLLPLPSP